MDSKTFANVRSFLFENRKIKFFGYIKLKSPSKGCVALKTLVVEVFSTFNLPMLDYRSNIPLERSFRFSRLGIYKT